MANERKLPTLAQALQGIGNAHAYIGNMFVENMMDVLGQKQGRLTIRRDQNWSQMRAEDITGPIVHDESLLGEDLVATLPMIMDLNGDLIVKGSPMGVRGVGWQSPQIPIDTGVAIIPDREVGGGIKFDRAWSRLAGNGAPALPTALATVSAAGAAQDATSVPVTALPSAIKAGTNLIFLPGANKTARVTVDAAASATSLTVLPIPTALVSADAAPYQPTPFLKLALFIWRARISLGDLSYGVEDGGRMIVDATIQAKFANQVGVPDGMMLGYLGDPTAELVPPTGFVFSSVTT